MSLEVKLGKGMALGGESSIILCTAPAASGEMGVADGSTKSIGARRDGLEPDNEFI
jgi:hypothetical protein